MSIDPKSIPYDDYKTLLKEKADLEARFESQKASNHNLQSQLSKLRKNQGVSSEPVTEETSKEAEDPRYLELQSKIDKISAQLTQTVTSNEQKQPLTVTGTRENSTYSVGSNNLAAPVSLAPEEKHIHNFKYFQPFCTGGQCGVNSKNPEFVPEMKCKNCNGVVGSFESIKKRVITGDQPNCPFCGQDLKAVPITDEAKRKVQEYLASPKVAVPA